MKLPFIISLVTILSASIGCNPDTRNSFAIRDFNKALQPYLIQVVSQGIVGFDTATRYIRQHATDKELRQLSQCEHPVLRALSFREMLKRPTFNHFDLMMKNLDDTAMVATDAGEFGIRHIRVSDDMLEHGKWKDTNAKLTTIKEIVLKHNYLSSAYLKLRYLGPKDIYYPYVRDMAQREGNYFDNFEQKEDALYALASYKRSEDIPLIQQLIISDMGRIGGTSFALMAQFPNEKYLEVYEYFFPRNFYRRLCRDRDDDIAVSFIKSIAVYKNERSDKILSQILNRKPFVSCPADTSYLKEELAYAIWNNPCPAYIKIRKQVESYIKQYEEFQNNHHIEPVTSEIDSTLFPEENPNEAIKW